MTNHDRCRDHGNMMAAIGFLAGMAFKGGDILPFPDDFVEMYTQRCRENEVPKPISIVWASFVIEQTKLNDSADSNDVTQSNTYPRCEADPYESTPGQH